MARDIVTSENREEFIAKKMAEKSGRAYDPGEVNIPLEKRGDIDKQLDKYKAEQKELKEAKSKEFRKEAKSDKQRAKAIYDKHLPTILEKTKEKFGEDKVRGMMSDWVKNDPEKLVKFFEKFSKEHKIQE
jgi:hypothetical protein